MTSYSLVLHCLLTTLLAWQMCSDFMWNFVDFYVFFQLLVVVLFLAGTFALVLLCLALHHVF